MLPAVEPICITRLFLGQISQHATRSLGRCDCREVAAERDQVVIGIRGVANPEFDDIEVPLCPEPVDLRPVCRCIDVKNQDGRPFDIELGEDPLLLGVIVVTCPPLIPRS